MKFVIKNYGEMFKKFISYYSNPILRKAKGVNPALSIWRFGDSNPDKIIYFITDVSSSGSGIFSLYLDILQELSFAKAMGWVPVVDDTAQLLRRTKVTFRKNRNVMDEYFDFSNSISVEEVKRSKYVIISSITSKVPYKHIFSNNMYRISKDKNIFECDEIDLQYWRNFAKNNLKYRINIQNILDEACKKLIDNKNKIVGVALREGKMGMTNQGLVSSSERKQPTLQETLEKTKECLEKWKYKYVYLSCECDKTVEVFKEYFGEEKILYLERIRLDFDYLTSIKSMKEGVNKAKKNAIIMENYSRIDLEYIEDMYILSKCNSCILPVNCGTEAAFIHSEGYENVLVF